MIFSQLCLLTWICSPLLHGFPIDQSVRAIIEAFYRVIQIFQNSFKTAMFISSTKVNKQLAWEISNGIFVRLICLLSKLEPLCFRSLWSSLLSDLSIRSWPENERKFILGCRLKFGGLLSFKAKLISASKTQNLSQNYPVTQIFSKPNKTS